MNRRYGISECFWDLESLDQLVDIRQKNNLFAEICNSQNEIFEPTITSFKNAIVINYKKVGTRFFETISSWPQQGEDKISNQIDIRFLKNIEGGLQPTKLLNGGMIANPFEGTYTPFKTKWNNIEEFFEYHDVKNWDEFLFKNPKEIIFVVRNPVQRFLSGVSQVMAGFMNENIKIEDEREDLKKNSGPENLTDLEIRTLMRSFNNPKHMNHIENEISAKVTTYILKYRWDQLLKDIHTDNYLVAFSNWINQIEDKSKIKIINLEDCKTKEALSFFNYLRGDTELESMWADKNNFIDSNKKIYNSVAKSLMKTETFFWVRYLKHEIHNFIDLLNSEHYIDLKQKWRYPSEADRTF
jgi:hypothetical protein